MKKREGHSIDALFLVVVFIIFTFSAISALVLAVQFYQGTIARSDGNETSRVAVAYLREAVHQSDTSLGIDVVSFDGVDCIELAQEEGYVRRLYFYDGKLMDLYARSDAEISAKDGSAIMALTDMSLEMKDGIIRIGCTDTNGQTREVLITPKSDLK